MSLLKPQAGPGFQNAQVLATACKLAYLPAAAGAAEFQQQLGLQAELISVDNTQVYVAQGPGEIVLAFRGSESPTSLDGFKDWLLTNAKNFLTVPAGRAGTDFIAAGVGCRFHRGFLDALEEIWEPLYARVDDLRMEQERPVWVTGHSLGGAIALLAAWRLERQFIPIQQVYTFGAPMIGNEAAATALGQHFAGRIYRFVDTRDLVPRLPTVSLFTNEYAHCHQEVKLGPLTTQDVFQELAGKAADQLLSLSTMDEIWGRLHQGVDCHLMPNYLDRIAEQIKA